MKRLLFPVKSTIRSSLMPTLLAALSALSGCGENKATPTDESYDDSASDPAESDPAAIDAGDESSDNDLDGTDSAFDTGAEEDTEEIPAGCEGVIQFKDPSLEFAVRSALDIPEGDLTFDQVKNLIELSASIKFGCKQLSADGTPESLQATVPSPSLGAIHDLSGLECLVGLKMLNLSFNAVSDLTPLASLTGLTTLYLTGNLVEDITPLAGLTQLDVLGLSYNNIRDLSPLSGLTALTVLGLMFSEIDNIDDLAPLTGLTALDVQMNRIEDISVVSGLINLNRLYLRDNYISDISPLDASTFMKDGGTLDLRGNPVRCDDTGSTAVLDGLKARDVTVDSTCKTESVDIMTIERTPLSVETLTGTWTCDDNFDDTASMILNEDGTASMAGSAGIPIFEQGAWSVDGDTLSWSYEDADNRYTQTQTVALIDDTLYLEAFVRNLPPSDPASWDGTFVLTEVGHRQSLTGTDEVLYRDEYALVTDAGEVISTERSEKTTVVDGETEEQLWETTYWGIGTVDWTNTDMEVFVNHARVIDDEEAEEEFGGGVIFNKGPRIAVNVLLGGNTTCTKVN